MVRNRWLRVTAKGEIIAACPRCGKEMQLGGLRPVLRVGRAA